MQSNFRMLFIDVIWLPIKSKHDVFSDGTLIAEISMFFTIYNFYKTSHRMMVLLLADGVRTKKEKQPRNFALNVVLSEGRSFADNKSNT